MEPVDLNKQDAPLPPLPPSEPPKTEDLKPTSKGVENAKKRLRAFSIQKKSSLSPVPLTKPVCTTVGSIGTVFIGKLASSKPALKPGDIEEVVDPKKPPKPPKPGTSKLQNVYSPLADYLNIQKKTLSEIEDMKRKMELVDLGIPLGLICPATNGDKAMPTKAMPPIKSMLLARKLRVLRPANKEAMKPHQKRSRIAAVKNPAKVDEIIREAKKAKAEGKSFKFNYEKLLPSYQNPFQKSKDKDRDKESSSDDRQSRERRKYGDSYRRYSSHKDDKRSRDWHRDSKDRVRASVIREREVKEEKIKRSKERTKKDAKSKESEERSKDRDLISKEDPKLKDKIDTINLSDDDDDIQEVTQAPEKSAKETDVNLKDFVVCDSWSENEDRKDPTPNPDKLTEKESKSSPEYVDPMEQLKQSLTKETETVLLKVQKLQPVTDTFKFEIEDDNEDEEILDMFAESNEKVKTSLKKIPLPKAKKNLYDSPVPMRFDYDTANEMDESFLESVIAEIKQEDMDDDTTQDKGLVEYDSPKDDRESVTPEIDDRIREMYSRSEYSDGFKSVDSVKSSESGFKSTESGYKSTESYKSETRPKEGTFKVDNRKSSDRKKTDYKSFEYKSTDLKFKESGYKNDDVSKRLSDDASILEPVETPRPEVDMPKATVDSLETWSFVLKICQPLLFRHDKTKCYKESQVSPKIWWAENPKLCDCVRDRSVVYEELEMCKMDLVNSVYGSDQVVESESLGSRGWYGVEERGQSPPRAEGGQSSPRAEGARAGGEGGRQAPPRATDEMMLDREYQKFMEAVWPEVEGPKSETPRSTPVRETKKRPVEEEEGKKKRPRLEKMSSEGWSQDSEVEDVEKNKKQKVEKLKRKRKYSPAISDSDDESPSKKKKALRKEKKEKAKLKASKRQRLSKKYLKKLKEKQLKKKKKLAKLEESDTEELERERKKKEKKLKKKKLLKKKKSSKKKSKARSSSSSSSDSDSDRRSRKKEKRKRKKRKQSSSDSNQSDETFDVNILNNIKTERLTDDEKKNFSPNKKHREIINVKQLQNDFVSFQIKKEIEDVNSPDEFEEGFTEEEKKKMGKRDADRKESERIELEKKEQERIELEKKELERIELEKKDLERLELEKKELKRLELEKAAEKQEQRIEECVEEETKEVVLEKDEPEFKEPETARPVTPPKPTEETSQCSSQESVSSAKPYEKDDSHLRPSSQNSNYNFHDVMENEHAGENELYQKERETEAEGYEEGNYEMYEQMAMEYQSDVASQRACPPESSGRIETVVRARVRGEIKCDWRAGDPPRAAPAPTPAPRTSRWGSTEAPRPSRWGLKPNEVNIVLTGGEGEPSEGFRPPSPSPSTAAAPVYQIQSIVNRTDNSNMGYDEAYMDMYGASDRLQYGDCFAREPVVREVEKKPVHSSLDDRINLALQTTVLGEVAKDDQTDEMPDKGILVTKSLAESRSVKRVSFADGYKPGQDSDTEAPPVRKKKRSRRVGCPWPCPASHADHVSLWDALPPPPPPPGSPPPPPAAAPAAHLLRAGRAPPAPPALPPPPHPMHKFDPNSLAAFMPPEPPPGLISF